MTIKRLESKDPNSTNVSYKIDFSSYLPDGVVIASVVDVFSDDDGIAVTSYQIANSGKSIVVRLSGGTLGQDVIVTGRYRVGGETNDRSFKIFIEDL